MFYITAEIYIFGVIVFLLIGSGDLQPWAKQDKYQRMNENNNNIENAKQTSTL